MLHLSNWAEFLSIGDRRVHSDYRQYLCKLRSLCRCSSRHQHSSYLYIHMLHLSNWADFPSIGDRTSRSGWDRYLCRLRSLCRCSSSHYHSSYLYIHMLHLSNWVEFPSIGDRRVHSDLNLRWCMKHSCLSLFHNRAHQSMSPQCRNILLQHKQGEKSRCRQSRMGRSGRYHYLYKLRKPSWFRCKTQRHRRMYLCTGILPLYIQA